MNFRIWANVRSMGPTRFFVTVSTASEHDPDRTGGVESGEASTLEEATALRDALIDKLGARLKARGHTVIDIKLE